MHNPKYNFSLQSLIVIVGLSQLNIFVNIPHGFCAGLLISWGQVTHS